MGEPIPVERLVFQVCDGGSDFDDVVMGYCSGAFDKATGVLTLKFERDEDSDAYPEDDFTSAEYTFTLVVPR